MFRNNIKIAWRNLKKQPFFTFLNTFGLAMGMAGALLICLYIYDELSYDTMFPDADRIHRVNVDIKFGGEVRNFAVTPAPMAETIKNDFDEVEMVTRFRTRGSMLIRKTDAQTNVKEEEATFVDSSFFGMFGIPLLSGDSETALTRPNTLVLTETAAKKHFGVESAVGQTVVLNNTENYTVAGVIPDFPHNSFLRDYSVFLSMAGFEDAQIVNWGSNNYQTYIKLIPSANVEDIQAPLRAFLGKYMIPGIQQYLPGITEEQLIAAGNYVVYSTIPMTNIHLRSHRGEEISTNNDIQSIYILSFIALFLIVLASVNFMNLSTANSLKRAKEVGVRKAMGSKKGELIRQFMIESGVISFLSLILAIVIAAVSMPFFNNLANKDISIPYFSWGFWSAVLLSTVILALSSGSYPAFFMSKFRPIKVLKGSGKTSVGGGRIRNMLVIFQFIISVFLIVSTIVVYQQLNYIQNKDLGYSKDQVLIIDDVYTAGNRVETFKEEVKQLAFVENASLSSFFPTPSDRGDSTFAPEDGATQQENAVSMQRWGVDHDYLPTMDFELLAGRNFDSQFGTDSSAIIVNESALAIMGLSPKEAIGKQFTPDMGEESPEFFTIVGVVKNFHFDSLRENIDALSLHLEDGARSMAVKIEAENFSNAVSSIERIWNEIVPGEPFNYYFMEDSFNDTYQTEQRLGRIFIIFTILSILIACLGLFGLALFNAEKRTKEIGVRKVLGANVAQITYTLTLDFLKLVSVAILVSLPLGWYAMERWLEDFSYHIEIDWSVFVLASLLAIVISILSVGYQSVRAAVANPIKSLRTE
ncbi:ABC transporter permease [Muricauda sp. MAR_2010_75]|jgi:putative ABC transport system permease protein|uniref:ABC transporter permease n=1 Tax=Allomuricauda sp. MAR_2010_75 TaxID=1250232 RepID=UPI000564E0F7|nr:ABC transporter permease [Muricauda sp. MAR_2010_75]